MDDVGVDQEAFRHARPVDLDAIGRTDSLGPVGADDHDGCVGVS